MSRETGKRAQNRAAMEAEILRLGREHLATQGAAALSLRSTARDLDVASSAVYRYVESRDELLTRLIVAGYESLADAVDEALAGVDPTDLREVVTRAAWASRGWALAHPHDYALLYGSPVPDYQAPAERTNDAGTRVMMRLLQVRAASPNGPARASYTDAALASVAPWEQELRLGSSAIFLDLIDAWTLMTGAISREVFSQFGDLPDPEGLFAHTLTAVADLYAGTEAVS